MQNRISLPIERIEKEYEVVVIGSGYGGSIAASRLSRAGKKVCLLERGKEIRPGEFPNKESEAIREVQFSLPEDRIGSEAGLYDFHLSPDISVLVGCGLGGTSLINANVSLRADKEVFQDECWPKEIRVESSKNELNPYYALAEEMLKPNPYPSNFPNLNKLQALKQSSQYVEGKFYRVPINVTFTSGINHVGVKQDACVNCGDCVSGCNYSSKNTTLMNYLPDAYNHGASIFTESKVRYIEKSGEGWLVHFDLLGLGRELFGKDTLFVRAKTVILSAGTLGSTEILLRSRLNGLSTSDVLGTRFTGNGDMLGFSYNQAQHINGIGFGFRNPKNRIPVGPCITGVIDTRDYGHLEEGMVIEEGSIPGAIGRQLPELFSAAAKLWGKNIRSSASDFFLKRFRTLVSFIFGPYRGAVRNSQTYLVMAHDGSSGQMSLEKDRLRIRWPGIGQRPIFQKISSMLEKATIPGGGIYIKNPVWNNLTKQDLITVHPLGGCVMGESGETGVVNGSCQVYSSETGEDVHEGLYVMDGSVIPRSVGVNPLLTIAAIAERACQKLAERQGWKIGYALPSKPPIPDSNSDVPGIEFTESMKGFYSAQTDNQERGFEIGKNDGTAFEFELTIRSENVDEMIRNPSHKAGLIGTVKAPKLSVKALTVTNGEFELFIERKDRIETRNMVYKMIMHSVEGKSYRFKGEKWIQNDGLINLWRDTTTLYITIYDGPSEMDSVLGVGILHILPEDFAKQMTTMNVINSKGFLQKTDALIKFGKFFAGALYDVYGRLASSMFPWEKDARPREKRKLNVSAPIAYYFNTQDGVQLRLLRYRGGKKGPVLLSPGLGVSSLIFSIDTIDVNLLEFLFGNGYDVWLFDYRTSIALGSAPFPNSGDPIAKIDYPAAVAKVKEITGADSIQVVAHCFGSTTFFMAMLAGLSGVRSAVISQIATNVEVPTLMQLKVGLHVSEVLDALGVKDLTAYAGKHPNWADRILDKLSALQPQSLTEHDMNPVSRRITFLYGQLYRLENLNEETYRYGLREMFGVGNIKAFEHLSKMVRAKHVVDDKGNDTYIPSFERLNLPITILHGALNECYLPESTEKTYSRLVDTFGPEKYQRHLIPGYGHIDCIFGKNAYKDVFPIIVKSLDAYS
ncbi:GMC oxidoreductase [Leptospira fainei serovar Hurstbridge str. BUT 6]|uniref:Cholesterol oxidase n=1 Tax=Leptospira fainei serovar Hurstbridge str. BUT 6 TaxID=1193011 RepID=S3UZ19_9LEPT|nr:GMC family oxidoreductase N-terminal domain-containing protein [Leptospira fainei]EPG73584.1 GMC oxidoreductase [Leptospira fainei serovar Hurstbridge str. BUT 6]